MTAVQRWLNPPGATQPDNEPAPVLLSAEEITLLRDLLKTERQQLDDAIRQDTETSGGGVDAVESERRHRRGVVTNLLSELGWASVPPDEAECSREATWHPANQLSRLMPTVLARLARWSGGACLVANAVQYSAAVEADRHGWPGVQDVAEAAINAGQSATQRAYGPVDGRE